MIGIRFFGRQGIKEREDDAATGRGKDPTRFYSGHWKLDTGNSSGVEGCVYILYCFNSMEPFVNAVGGGQNPSISGTAMRQRPFSRVMEMQ